MCSDTLSLTSNSTSVNQPISFPPRPRTFTLEEWVSKCGPRSPSPENLLEMQNQAPHSRPRKSETLGDKVQQCVITQPQVILTHPSNLRTNDLS